MLTSHVSGIREIREGEFNPSTCEVVSSENARGKANITSRGFVKGRYQGWMPQLAKLRNSEERRQPLDPGRGRTAGSGTPSPIVHSGVRRLRGPLLDIRSREVPKLGTRDMWQNHKVGPGDRQADPCRLVKGVNTPLTSHVSGIHGIRARKLDAEPREVTSSKRC